LIDCGLLISDGGLDAKIQIPNPAIPNSLAMTLRPDLAMLA